MLYRGKDGRHGQSPGELDGVQLKGQSQTKRNKKKRMKTRWREVGQTLFRLARIETLKLYYTFMYTREKQVQVAFERT